jgi:hypothetical protein
MYFITISAKTRCLCGRASLRGAPAGKDVVMLPPETVNHDSFSLEDDFTQIITGEIGSIGRVLKLLRDDIPEIDVYLWIDATDDGGIDQVRRLFRHQNPLKETVRDLLQLG